MVKYFTKRVIATNKPALILVFSKSTTVTALITLCAIFMNSQKRCSFLYSKNKNPKIYLLF